MLGSGPCGRILTQTLLVTCDRRQRLQPALLRADWRGRTTISVSVGVELSPVPCTRGALVQRERTAGWQLGESPGEGAVTCGRHTAWLCSE